MNSMENTMKELEIKQIEERREFVQLCPHTEVKVEDTSFGSRRSITIRCARCDLNLVGYLVDNPQSYLSYVQECVKDYPGNIKNIPGSSYHRNKEVENDKG